MNETYVKSLNLFTYLQHANKLWYLVNPYDTSFKLPIEVPDYQQEIWISFFFLIVLEQVILYAKKQSTFRLNDHVTSISHWMLQESGRIFFRGAEYYIYINIYEKYHIWNLPWNSAWTWYITAISVDFCYYWVHRANHEIHFLWAQHQVHHSSEEFNLVVGLRQSILQQWCSFMFYLPLGIIIPPSHFIAHHQFNLIYQLWIHTTVIDNLGFLELIFNTPQHHRVHHGCNLYCLDKNYGGVFIIWDRLFGTFIEEQSKGKIVYGLVVSPRSFNPLYLQTFYTTAMIKKSINMNMLMDKLAVIWKGPSWLPGLPRLGLDEYKINVISRVKFNPSIPIWQTFYITLHFSIIFSMHFYLYDDIQNSGTLIMNNIFALTTIGLLFDEFEYANVVELMRCIIYLIFFNCNFNHIFFIYLSSCCIWIIDIINQRKKNMAKANKLVSL
ncbi:hypothetical protein PV327_008827 [Microctonus hyperodae]|uniref:Fatty acid hydroxylase domain-containing protein n=1 Tax=Microctonus hyperodae TaxID=165561 RepID=A0AA39FSJ3_MICHY|nr:hypothetical protein PV327_008827 [Microctonus hyperodae]